MDVSELAPSDATFAPPVDTARSISHDLSPRYGQHVHACARTSA
jgi:hypothetical protein